MSVRSTRSRRSRISVSRPTSDVSAVGIDQRDALLLNRLRGKGRVLAEDRQLDCSEVGARLEPQFVDKAVAGLTEDVERLDLAAGAVESDHMEAA